MKTYGSCFCNQIKFMIDKAIPSAWNCYCKHCRKLHGSAVATHIVIKKKEFRWIQGEDNMTFFKSSLTNSRGFCKTCGSQLIIIDKTHPDLIVIVYACLDANSLAKPIGHLFVASKVTWFDIHDTLPQFDALPPESFWKDQT